MRFPEFSGEYKKTNLNSIATRINRKAKESSHASVRMISYGNGFILQDEKYGKDNAGSSLKNYTLLRRGEFAYNHGASKNKPYGVCYRLKEDNEARVPFVYHCFSIDTNNNYWEYALNTKSNDKQLKKLISSSVRMDGLLNISFENYVSIFINVPPAKEQRKIATFLDLIETRISTQNKIIDKLESLICSLRSEIFNKFNWKWNKLDYYVKLGIITLKRGNVIPKHEKSDEYKYPVYSSSVHNNGLMGFNDSYMFDKELVTWSVDGGGNFFYRPKHKFNVTNVCGIMEVTNNTYNYRFLSEILLMQHSKLIFDYQTKAHPSVITQLYKLPNVDINVQEQIALIFDLYYKKLQKEKDILSLYKKQKAYLLQNMFI